MKLDQPLIEQIRAAKALHDRAAETHNLADHRAAQLAATALMLALNFALDDDEELEARRERQRIAAERARLDV